MMDWRAEITDAMVQLDEGRVLAAVDELVGQGESYHGILELLNQGSLGVGERFESGDYFIGDLIVAGMIFRAALKHVPYETSNEPAKPIGTVVIGVVQDDIHSIGKDIVVDILRAERFDVIDLGVDVEPQRFIRAVQEYKPDVLLLSGLLRTAQRSMIEVVEALDEAGAREGLSVIIGGGCASTALCEQMGADAFAESPLDTLKFCKQVMERRN